MERHHGNYEAFKALHDARMQAVRASAMAAAAARRERRGDASSLRRIVSWLGAWQRQKAPSRASVRTFFWT